MGIITVVLIAFGLAMDAFAVSITGGLTIKSLKISGALKIALFLGSFQGIMPLLGWFAGLSFRGISAFDHWVAFGLLTAVGAKMIYESLRADLNGKKTSPLNTRVLVVLSLATSIDALAVGLSLSLLSVSIVLPAIVIGVVTFLLSFLGVYLGNSFGHYFRRRIEIIGGLVLICIGARMLIEHLA